MEKWDGKPMKSDAKQWKVMQKRITNDLIVTQVNVLLIGRGTILICL